MKSKLYVGTRSSQGCAVTVNGRPLAMRLDLANKSPTGFEWGYGGSGPSQLALAILADHLHNDEAALAAFQDFKARVIARLPKEEWKLTSEEIDRHLSDMIIERQRGAHA